MLFQHTVKLILSGKKTQTRRVIKSSEIAVRGRNNQIEAVVVNGRDKWRVGKTYAVQPSRGKEQVARIKLIAINSERISRITTSDAHAEGFKSRHEFFKVWCKIHGEDGVNMRAWVLKFEVVNATKQADELSQPPQKHDRRIREPANAY